MVGISKQRHCYLNKIHDMILIQINAYIYGRVSDGLYFLSPCKISKNAGFCIVSIVLYMN